MRSLCLSPLPQAIGAGAFSSYDMPSNERSGNHDEKGGNEYGKESH